MDFIKVADLIASRDMAGHNAVHDAYFGQYPDWKPLSRKPFFTFAEVVPTLAQLSAVLDMADLFRGVKVLDYGCGSGWLARALGYLGCDVTGVDVSARAIDWARETIAADRACDGLPIRFELIDGVRLPYTDGSFDRIVCFSAFHHVADQAATLAEFARVLTDGGRVVFNEPGEHHSSAAESQAEMRQHGVIENDVVIEDIARQARTLGFGAPRMAFFATFPVVLDLDDYQRAVEPGAHARAGAQVYERLAAHMHGARTFCLVKGDAGQPDSRRTKGLGGSLKVTVLGRQGDELRCRAVYQNTGSSHWRPSLPVAAGAVAIGIHKQRTDGGIEEARIPLGRATIAPGTGGEIEFMVPVAGFAALHFDLVAEWVSWFDGIGARASQVVDLRA
jgi:SAM-dependent methyltransferase